VLVRNWLSALTGFWEGGSGAQRVDLLSSVELGFVALRTGEDECKKLED
jgi:hypothetical protein